MTPVVKEAREIACGCNCDVGIADEKESVGVVLIGRKLVRGVCRNCPIIVGSGLVDIGRRYEKQGFR